MASQKIGALWKRQSKDGKVFYSGVIQDIRGDINIAVFVNDRKESDKHPDLNIVRSEDREDKKTQSADPFDFGQNAPMNDEPQEDVINIDDIPFS